MRSALFIWLALVGLGGSAKLAAMGCETRIAFVVDPWSSAHYLVEALEARGIIVHGIQTEQTIPVWAGDSFYLAPGRELLHLRGDNKALLEQVRLRHPTEILVGADGDGIILTDFLAQSLGLRGNGTDLSNARRLKDKMQLALGRGGLRFIDSVLTADFEEARAFANRIGYPVFLKPNDAGGGQFNIISADEASLRADLLRVANAQNNTTLKTIGKALIQPVVDGVEYAIQGVVRDGHTKISSIIQYEKVPIQGYANTYRSEWTVDARTREAQMLIAYVLRANPALQMRNGPFHWEIKISPMLAGAVAIELNARLAGGKLVEFLKDCVGYNEVDLTVEAYFFPDEFARRPDIYTIRHHGFRFAALTPRPGLALRESILARAAKLPGFKRMRRLLPPGALPQTIDLDTTPLYFEFVSDSPQVLEASFAQLLEWQYQESYFSPVRGLRQFVP